MKYRKLGNTGLIVSEGSSGHDGSTSSKRLTLKRMGEGRFFSSTALKGTVARLGILVVLILLSQHIIHGQERPAVSELVRQFQGETVFWRQFEVAKAIVTAKDTGVLPQLEPWLTHEDRQLRGNAAFIFAQLGDSRGFEVIVAILSDRSERRQVDNISSVGLPDVQGQITQDRYYAAHLLGNLKDPRAISILVPLLTEPVVKDIVPWSLAQIGNRSAIPPLIRTLVDPDPSMRVLAIHALADLKATDALPPLRQLLDDTARSNFDKSESVAEAAQSAIGKLQSETAR
jgi:HEAT repeat protein